MQSTTNTMRLQVFFGGRLTAIAGTRKALCWTIGLQSIGKHQITTCLSTDQTTCINSIICHPPKQPCLI